MRAQYASLCNKANLQWSMHTALINRLILLCLFSLREPGADCSSDTTIAGSLKQRVQAKQTGRHLCLSVIYRQQLSAHIIFHRVFPWQPSTSVRLDVKALLLRDQSMRTFQQWYSISEFQLHWVCIKNCCLMKLNHPETLCIAPSQLEGTSKYIVELLWYLFYSQGVRFKVMLCLNHITRLNYDTKEEKKIA